ncbi:MAG TPA: HEAT repeat domain-containing protein [Vicinamibacteria bacterium]|nr:HEAT repeat domain-containing protein [Vicinamibacteria bacterium]
MALVVALFGVWPAVADQAWDDREAQAVRNKVYLRIASLPDFSQIKQTLELALNNDPSSVPVLLALIGHPNETVAGTAAQALGRFTSSTVSSALQAAFQSDSRSLVRSGALMGLARMKDTATVTLAKSALSDADLIVQGAGVNAIYALGDPANGPTILSFLDQHPGDYSGGDLLEDLARLGNPPGSTVVSDRLLAEANNKMNPFDYRYSAAFGLKTMGLAAQVQGILDRQTASDTYNRMVGLKSAMTALAASKSMSVSNQADVDALVAGATANYSRLKQDLWGNAVRVVFVSSGVFQVVSNGPDQLPNTADDQSTAETWPSYDARMFKSLFQ